MVKVSSFSFDSIYLIQIRAVTGFTESERFDRIGLFKGKFNRWGLSGFAYEIIPLVQIVFYLNLFASFEQYYKVETQGIII